MQKRALKIWASCADAPGFPPLSAQLAAESNRLQVVLEPLDATFQVAYVLEEQVILGGAHLHKQ